MKLRILGCSGGIGRDLRTPSMLLEHDILIDAAARQPRGAGGRLSHRSTCARACWRKIAKFKLQAAVFISHLKPGEIEVTIQEIQERAGARKPRRLGNSQIFDW